MSSQPSTVAGPAAAPVRRRSPWSAYRVALVVIGGLVACVLFHLKFTYDKSIHDAETLIQALAVASEQHIGGSLEAVDSLLDELAATVREGRHQDRRFMDDIDARLPSYPEIRFLGLVSADGMLLPQTWPAGTLPSGPIDVSQRSYFIEQRDATGPARLVIGAPVHGHATGERTLHLSRPIRDKNGNFAGVVLAAVNPDVYATFLSSILYDEAGSCGLISLDGRMVARAPNQAAEFGRNIADSDLIRLWVPRKPVGVAHLVAKTDGNDKLLAYRVMPEFSLMVTAGVSRDKALAGWRRMAMVEVALLAAFSGLLLYWTRHIRHQNTQLAAEQHNMEDAVAQRSVELEQARSLAERRAVQLSRINGELKRLTLVAAHHLQEPLRSMVSCSQMLPRSMPSAVPGLEERIEAVCQRGVALKASLSAFESRVADLTRRVVATNNTGEDVSDDNVATPEPDRNGVYSARVVALSIAAALLAGAALQSRNDYRDALAAGENLTTAVVKSIAHHLQTSFRRIDSMLDDVALAAEDGRASTEAFRERLVARLATMPEVRLVGVADSSGRLWPRTWPDHAGIDATVDISDREYFREQARAPRRGQLVLGRPRLSQLEKQRSIQFSHPLIDEHGRFDGVVVASINPDLYARFLETVLLDEDGATAVITLSGHMLARAPKHEEKFGIDISSSDLFVRYLPRAPEGNARLVSKADGNEKLLGYRVLPGFPLVVTSGYSLGKALAEWRMGTALTTVLALTASIILYLWAHRADQHGRRLSRYRQHLAGEVAARTASLADAHRAAQARSDRLADANTRMHDLIRLIAAEVQQPLKDLDSHIDDLRRLAGGRSGEGDHWLGFITAGSIHLNALLRDYPRYVAALCDEPSLRAVNSNAVVEDAVERIRARWDHTHIRFDIQPLPPVQADPTMLFEVLLQLFSNAATHCRDHRPVTVTVSAEPQEIGWRFTVADNGPGLPPINTDHLFRAFETAHDRNPDSTGLGLPLCRVLVHSHGGRIWATSLPGKGCAVHFTLPAADTTETEVA